MLRVDAIFCIFKKPSGYYICTGNFLKSGDYNTLEEHFTKINTLPDEKMYPLLMTLVNKYGREADLAEGENNKNVYCVAGSKVLTCKHHVHMAKYFENPRESEGVLNFVRDNFCVDGGDKFYCVNCGQEVYIALTKADIGRGLVAGLCVAFISIIADRIIKSGSDRLKIKYGMKL